MQTWSIEGKTVSLFPAAVPDAPVLYLNTVAGEGLSIFQLLQDGGCPPFSLVSVSDLQWERDMAPWDCPAVFHNAPPFTGGADAYLQLLTGRILPQAESRLCGTPAWRGIAGYSLAGLFAIYAIYETDLFSRVASMSGSLWFPGIRDYLLTHEPKCRPEHMYFSLGDKEHKTRNPLMRGNRQNTLDIQAFFQQQGIDTVFVSHRGNHFDHAAERTAAGLAWLLQA